MDVDALLQQVNLVSLAEAAGARFNGGCSSHCPLHGGDNPSAFHIYIAADGRQRWHCFTNCPPRRNDGDALAFWMAWRKVDFPTALRELAEWAGSATEREPGQHEYRQPPAPVPMLRAAPMPPVAWRSRAGRFTAWATRQLWGDGGAAARHYLHARGLRDATIRAARLGWNPRVAHDRAGGWGLDPGERPVVLHAGITIPHFTEQGQVQGVKIRCFAGGEPVAANGQKYRGPRGGRMALYGMNRWADLPVLLLVEGEFDALLAWQEAGDLLDVATLAGARAQLDAEDALALLAKAALVTAYDADAAGRAGGAAVAARWSRAMQVQSPDHDLTDFWVHGGNLRAWLAGVAAEQLEQVLARVDRDLHSDTLRWWRALLERCTLAQGGGTP